MLEIIREALEAAMYRPGDESAEKCREALTALRGLDWKPMAELEAFEPQGVRIGYHGIVSWVMAPYIAYRRGEVTSTYTHFCRPILPTPPKREVE
jgi:hypothetical protein